MPPCTGAATMQPPNRRRPETSSRSSPIFDGRGLVGGRWPPPPPPRRRLSDALDDLLMFSTTFFRSRRLSSVLDGFPTNFPALSATFCRSRQRSSGSSSCARCPCVPWTLFIYIDMCVCIYTYIIYTCACCDFETLSDDPPRHRSRQCCAGQLNLTNKSNR